MVLIEYSEPRKMEQGGKLRCKMLCCRGPQCFCKVVKVVKIHFTLGLGTLPQAQKFPQLKQTRKVVLFAFDVKVYLHQGKVGTKQQKETKQNFFHRNRSDEVIIDFLFDRSQLGKKSPKVVLFQRTFLNYCVICTYLSRFFRKIIFAKKTIVPSNVSSLF